MAPVIAPDLEHPTGVHPITPERAPVTRMSWAQLGVVVAVMATLAAGGTAVVTWARAAGLEDATLQAMVATNADALDDCEEGLEELEGVPERLEAIDQRTYETAQDVREIRHMLMERGG
jgi:hypothetical protein